MSLYGNQVRLDGVPCGLVTRGSDNGEYLAVFERELASLEEIEAIRWEGPEVQGECILPAGYGFRVKEIGYDMNTRSYQVRVQVETQYLGDVTGYQEEIGQLNRELQAQAEQIQALEAAGTAAEVTAELTAAYREGVERNG